ncbi:hypothetical protein SASPL_115035 [Salvia splendens]|uniref:Myb/SANT-like domain-containing protein n=1 Tax=Salvia splendens TaxID=180675 RepID=A0A8X9A0X3_SALSN|nr:uncharacterized protein LOC121803469 [Salvia splendens]KAG6424617.1 hypothetical protein SASPL_115035 [Salvia splendens]
MADFRGSKATMHSSSGGRGTSRGLRPQQPKSERTRRIWTDREEGVLLATLKELVAQGWKSDNGFRVGYLVRLEEALRREFPTTDLKVNPNIISKVSAWKKSYYSLQQILNLSGIGFNLNEDHKIDCDDQQWAEIVKKDGNARFMRGKSWPYFDDWKEIFGKDRANGEGAEDIMDAVNNICSQENLGGLGEDNNYNAGLGDFFMPNQVPDHQSPIADSDGVFSDVNETITQKTSTKKRKAVGEMDDGLVEMLGKMHDATNDRLQCLASRIGYEFDLTKARKEVFDLVELVPGLSIRQQFAVCGFILDKVERLDFFMGLREAAKEEYVLMVLEQLSPK